MQEFKFKLVDSLEYCVINSPIADLRVLGPERKLSSITSMNDGKGDEGKRQ